MDRHCDPNGRTPCAHGSDKQFSVFPWAWTVIWNLELAGFCFIATSHGHWLPLLHIDQLSPCACSTLSPRSRCGSRGRCRSRCTWGRWTCFLFNLMKDKLERGNLLKRSDEGRTTRIPWFVNSGWRLTGTWWWLDETFKQKVGRFFFIN